MPGSTIPSAPPRWRAMLQRQPRQLTLPLEGMPSERWLRLQRAAKDFAGGFAPRFGQRALMRFGVPMVAAATPLAIGMFAPQRQDDWRANLLVGSGMGGAWGALVGGMLPFDGSGVRISRVKSAGMAAAGGIVMAPAVAAVSKYVVDWLTSPIRGEDAQREFNEPAPQASEDD